MKKKSKQVSHLGVFIKDELEEREWSQRDLAYILGCPEQSVTDIINGELDITPEMAKGLGMAFDVSPEFFMTLQQIYDLTKVNKSYKNE